MLSESILSWSSLCTVLLFSLSPGLPLHATAVFHESAAIVSVKQQILNLANSYVGQGDPDRSKQKSLERLVQQLLELSPQPPVKDRLSLLHGVWKQVWGPYDYRDDKRGVDPELGVDEIYQVVFPGGYYYNVSPDFPGGDHSKERIGLLRGKYSLDEQNGNLLRVKFTTYGGVKKRPPDTPLWELPALAEENHLKDRTTIVPTLIVRVFFGGGALREVYTDNDLRILYGSNGKDFNKESIYIMTRVK